MPMKRFVFAGVLLLDVYAAVQVLPVRHAALQFHANLAAAQQGGSGSVDAMLDTANNTLIYTVQWRGLSSAARPAWLEGPGEKGPAGTRMGEAAGDTLQGRLTLSDDQVSDLEGGGLGVTVPTQAHPAGEIQGVLLPIV